MVFFIFIIFIIKDVLFLLGEFRCWFILGGIEVVGSLIDSLNSI